MRRVLRFAAPLVVIGLGLAAVFALHASKPPPKTTDAPAVRATALFVEPVQRQAVTLSVTTQGEVQPLREIDLVAQVSGRVVRVAPAFVEGGSVAAGATLVEIEPDDYRLQVIEAEARVAEARLTLAEEEARAAIARKQWQWEEGKAKPAALALREPHVAQARARLAAAEAELENARLNLARTRISVPFDGRVREKAVDIGQFVAAGTHIGRVFATDRVQIRLPLTDSQFAEIGIPLAFMARDAGEGPAVTLSAALAGRIRHWRGHIVRTDAAIDPRTRLLYAIAEVAEPYGAAADEGVPLPVGLFVNAEISGREVDGALVVPREALRSGNRVYVVGADNRLAIRHVEVLSSDDERVVILAGLDEGERAVVSPLRAAREGMPVEAIRRDEAALIAQTSAAPMGGERP